MNRKKKQQSSGVKDATTMNSADTFHNAASAPPDDRDYGSYGQLSDVTNDSHTYDQLNKTRVH